MSAVIIPTARLDLVLLTPDALLARIEAMEPADRAEVSPDWLAKVRAATPGDPWALGFSVVERSTVAVVGDCGFKGPPDHEGCVEIAYGMSPEVRGRGYATLVVRILSDLATDFGLDRLEILADPDNLPSRRVAVAAGFEEVGERGGQVLHVLDLRHRKTVS